VRQGRADRDSRLFLQQVGGDSQVRALDQLLGLVTSPRRLLLELL
jgi:hypothetical protein